MQLWLVRQAATNLRKVPVLCSPGASFNTQPGQECKKQNTRKSRVDHRLVWIIAGIYHLARLSRLRSKEDVSSQIQEKLSVEFVYCVNFHGLEVAYVLRWCEGGITK
jgi:hypothetical protein